MKPNFSTKIGANIELSEKNVTLPMTEVKKTLYETLSLTRLTFFCNCGKRNPIFRKVSKKSVFEMWKTFSTGEKKTLKIIILSILTT
jgi:hypothetical protein